MTLPDPSTRASDPGISAWVAANAGAGKTYTLANRVTRLLLDDAKPQHILCLTFTKAAAAEMQGRLFDQLGRWSMLPDKELRAHIDAIGARVSDLPKARRLFAQALETPGGLKVLTIHAFCQILLSRFPLEANVPPGFDVLDEPSARALISEARRKVLERAGDGDTRLATAIAHLVTTSGESRLTDILDAALGNDRRKLDRFFEANRDGSFENAVWQAHGATRDDHAGNFCSALNHEIDRLREVKNWLEKGGKSDQDGGAKLAHALAHVQARDFAQETYAALSKFFLTDKGEPRKRLASKVSTDARPGLLAYLTDLQGRFCVIDEYHRAARAAGLAESALLLVDAVRKHYAAAKRRRGALDYDDLIIETLNLLGRREAAAWVLFKLDGGIDHILVDEAQDTSPEQWAILRKLTEEFFAGQGRTRIKPIGEPKEIIRTIFAVGDEKQSIFSFQGADPSQFDINRQYFQALVKGAELPFVEQPLVTSRRSAPEILAFVDTVFRDDAARAGLTSQDQPIAHRAHRETAKGGIEFWTALVPADDQEIDYYRPIDVEQASSPIVKLAEAIAGRIRDWLRRGTALPDHDAPIRPGDIMILLPRREPFGGEVIRQLKLRDVPVAGADRITLTEQIAVMDLISLGRFVLQRDDDLNLAALLRSPLAPVSEEELFALCHNRLGSLWQSLAARQGDLAAFGTAHIFLAEMLDRADYAPPFEFFSHALSARGGRRALIARLGPESADAIDEFLSLALSYEHANTPSLEGFLDWLDQGGTQIKRDMERGRDEVRVMTVHGAKGLEADIVILPDTTSLPEPPSRKGHLLYSENGVLFPVPEAEAPARVKAARLAETEESLKEHRRLLYVALTRAKDRLYVCGFQNQRGIRDGSWYRLAEQAAQSLGKQIRRGETEAIAYGHLDDTIRDASAPPVAAPIPAPGWLTRVAPREMVLPRLIRPSDALQEPAVFSPLDKGASRFRRGEVVHALLARLPEIPLGERREQALRFVAANGFAETAEALVAETLAVLNDSQFAAAFSRESRAEVAFLADLPQFGAGARVNGRIDRLAIGDAEILIVDFKTNRPPPATEENVSPITLGQMALYRAGAARIFPGRRIVCGLVWTDGPRLMRLSDAILDAQLAELHRRLDPDGVHS